MLTTIKDSFQDLLSFLKNPSDKASPDQRTSYKAKQLFSILAIELVLVMIFLTPILEFISEAGLVKMEDHKMGKIIKYLPVWLILVLTGLLAPIWEELAFRTFLRYKSNFPLKLVVYMAGLSGIRNKVKARAYIRKRWKRYYPVFFYLSAIIFAYVHLLNFEISTATLLLSPFLVLPQFLIGLSLGYMRVKFGLLWGIFKHSIYNVVLILFVLFFMNLATEKLDFKTEAYEIKIEEAAIRGTRNSSSAMGKSTVTFENVRLQEILLYLLDKDEKLLKTEDADKADLLLNISFTQWTDTINRQLVILNHLQEVYEFKINRKNNLIPVLGLQLSDSVRLHEHRTKLSDSVKTFRADFYSQEKKLILKNASADALTKHLNKNSDHYFVAEKGLAGTFNFELTLSTSEELEKELLEKYGISVVAGEKMAEQIMVKF